MIIRYVRPDDVSELLPLLKEFHGEVMEDFKVPFDEPTMIERINLFLKKSPVFVGFVAEENNKIVGFLGGIIASLMFNKNVSAFIESGWFVKKEYRKSGCGLRLIRNAIKYCKQNKINKMLIGNTGMVDNERYRRFYKRLGFNLFEQHFIKTVG